MEGNTTLTEEKLSEVTIDLGVVRKKQLNESWLSMFGNWVKWLLRGMFNNNPPATKVIGTRSEIDSFMKALGREKDYITIASKYGLNDPRTYKSKAKIEKAAREFNSKTGLKWPFR